MKMWGRENERREVLFTETGNWIECGAASVVCLSLNNTHSTLNPGIIPDRRIAKNERSLPATVRYLVPVVPPVPGIDNRKYF